MPPILRSSSLRTIRTSNPSISSVSTRTMTSPYSCSVANARKPGASPPDVGERSHHLKGQQGFTNPWPSWRGMTGFQIGSALLWRAITGKFRRPDTTPPTVPVRRPTFLPPRKTNTLRATWLGHACFLVDFPGGFRVLFDPVFTARCSPFAWLGPKRFTEMPCALEEIPGVDAVIISHNHYDHMSHPTMTKLRDLHPSLQFFVPLGNKQWCIDSGIHNVTEMDWWEEKEMTLSGPSEIHAKIGCLPCQHTSARTPFDKGRTLWASWSVESGGKKVWFGGDTGYRAVPELPKDQDDYALDLPHCPAFKQIGELRGPFDLGLVPIGAYDPRFIMSSMHANPFDSANIFVDTDCKRALGMHWGTWVLTEEDVLEPPQLLKQALAKKNIPETGVFDVCDIGESVEYP